MTARPNYLSIRPDQGMPAMTDPLTEVFRSVQLMGASSSMPIRWRDGISVTAHLVRDSEVHSHPGYPTTASAI
jgi:hypothetical protein